MNLEAQILEGGRGVIVATDSSLSPAPIALPLVFMSKERAQEFLSACERSGVSLYPEMGYSAMRQLFNLWYDAYKR